MALNAHLRLKGRTQGDIKGGVTQKGCEDSILVHAVAHEILSPRDPASGLSTGKRMHKPLVVTKDVDKSSPQLHTASANNENIVSLSLRFWRPNVSTQTGAGAETQRCTIELTNANIASIALRLPTNTDAALAKWTEYEEVAFTYEKITRTWNDGGIVATDEWASRTV